MNIFYPQSSSYVYERDMYRNTNHFITKYLLYTFTTFILLLVTGMFWILVLSSEWPGCFEYCCFYLNDRNVFNIGAFIWVNGMFWPELLAFEWLGCFVQRCLTLINGEILIRDCFWVTWMLWLVVLDFEWSRCFYSWKNAFLVSYHLG